MTERLAQMLRDEVAELHPSPPDAAHVLAEGRRLRRRRRVATGLAAATVVAVTGTTVGAVALVLGGPGTETPPTANDDAPVVFGVGSDVYVDDAVTTVPDTIHSLHYTSDGVLVRSNPNGGASDGSGPESLTLVRWDGSTADLGTIPEGVGPATDPDEPVYVLAEARGDAFVAVVRDAETGKTVDEVTLPDLPPSYWEVPPLSLDGDTLYAGFETETVALDLETGDQRTVEGLEGGSPEVHGGRTNARYGDSPSVIDAGTGEVLLEATIDGYGWFDLSPNGDYAMLVVEEGPAGPPQGVDVYDVATGSKVTLDGASYDWGWTADDRLFTVEGDTVRTCDPATGECAVSPAPTTVGRNAHLRLAGLSYES